MTSKFVNSLRNLSYKIKMPLQTVLVCTYAASIGVGGVIGVNDGFKKANSKYTSVKREYIKLHAPFKKYEDIIGDIIEFSSYTATVCSTSIISMIIVAGFPITIPAILYFSEEKNK